MLDQVAHGFGLGAIRSAEPVTDGLMNRNWRLRTTLGPYAVKQLLDRPVDEVRAAHALLPRLAELGFPVPVPCRTSDGDTALRVDGNWFTAAPWLPGAPARFLDHDACTRLGSLIGRLHVALASLCPPAPLLRPDVPLEPDVSLSRLAAYAARPVRDDFDAIAQREIALRRQLVAEVADLRPPSRDVGPCGWTHGDLQPFNVLAAAGHVTAILDWDRLGVRPYGLEVVRTATITFSTGAQDGLDLGRVAAFARGYRAEHPLPAAAVRDAADRRWWELVTETWPLDRHYRDNDPTADHLLPLRGNFARWWTTHRPAVHAALTD
jgi:Ser/Thr protein kinase RdoA (MazF antagonist)